MHYIRAKDHKQNEYKSLKDMYEAYGLSISYSAFIKRLDAGWSIRECLEGRIRPGKRVVYQKTLYRSIKELCIALDISAADFSRISKKIKTVGLTVDKCRKMKQIRQEEAKRKFEQELKEQNIGVDKKGQFEMFKGDK